MTRRIVPAGGLLIALCLVVPVALVAEDKQKDEQPAYSGAALFRTYCASCHGKDGVGDGPLADSLRVRPPDLTKLGKRSGGFQADKVHRIIDGRNPVKGHGGSDMPVWGDAFKSSRDGYDEESVMARIKALVEHLESIQQKEG